MKPSRLWWFALLVVTVVGLWAYRDLSRRAEFGEMAYEFLTREVTVNGKTMQIGDELVRLLAEQDGR